MNVADVPDEVQDEFTELGNDSTARDRLQEKTLTEFWCALRHSYPNVALLSLRVLVPFASTHLCESGFSSLLQIKTKARNRLDVQNDMRLALTQTKPRISKLVTQMQPRSSRKLLIILSFYVIFIVLRSHFRTIFFSKYILCNALFLLLTEKNWGSPTFLGNLKRVATNKRLGTTGLDQKI